MKLLKVPETKVCYYSQIVYIEKFMSLSLVSVIVILTIYKLVNVIIF